MLKKILFDIFKSILTLFIFKYIINFIGKLMLNIFLNHDKKYRLLYKYDLMKSTPIGTWGNFYFNFLKIENNHLIISIDDDRTIQKDIHIHKKTNNSYYLYHISLSDLSHFDIAKIVYKIFLIKRDIFLNKITNSNKISNEEISNLYSLDFMIEYSIVRSLKFMELLQINK